MYWFTWLHSVRNLNLEKLYWRWQRQLWLFCDLLASIFATTSSNSESTYGLFRVENFNSFNLSLPQPQCSDSSIFPLWCLIVFLVWDQSGVGWFYTRQIPLGSLGKVAGNVLSLDGSDLISLSSGQRIYWHVDFGNMCKTTWDPKLIGCRGGAIKLKLNYWRVGIVVMDLWF